jgi:hypothetical protein
MDHRTKLGWADKNLARLERDTREFIWSQPYVLDTEHRPKTRKHLVRVKVKTPSPADWSLVVGDILHNMRSALDHLTYSLAEIHLNRGLTDEEAKVIQFPICDNHASYRAEAGRRLQNLSDAMRTVIQGLQNYDLGRNGIAFPPLTMLRELSNRDKHRRILLTGAVVKRLQVHVKQPGGETEIYRSTFQGPFDDSTVVLEFPDADGHPHPKVNLEDLAAMDVSFSNDRPAWGEPIRPVLRRIHDHIANKVFPEFDAFL